MTKMKKKITLYSNFERTYSTFATELHGKLELKVSKWIVSIGENTEKKQHEGRKREDMSLNKT